jgi:predicted lactoylglutathione lyase
MRQKLNIITLGVSDFKKSLNFYKDKLGWKISPASQDDIAFFPMGGIVLAIHPKDLLAKDAGVKVGKSSFAGITLSYNAKSEKEVDEVLKTAEKAGGKIQKKAEKVYWGGYSGYFKDPDGYLWEVAHNPFFDFDKNDNLAI